MKIKIRSQFAATPGNVLLAMDLSQAESWVVAYLSGDQMMKGSLQNSDIHSDTAAFLFYDKVRCDNHEYHQWSKQGKGTCCNICGLTIKETERYVGKQNNHASAYGMGAERMAQVINKQSDKPPYVTVTIGQCRNYQTKWHQLYSGIKLWHEKIQAQLYADRTLITPYGFKRRFYEPIGPEMFKEAYAFIPQSTVLDHFAGTLQEGNEQFGGLIGIHNLISATNQVAKDPRRRMLMVNMSHDSCVLDMCRDCVEPIVEACTQYLTRTIDIHGDKFTIPVDFEIGTNYGELSKYDISVDS